MSEGGRQRNSLRDFPAPHDGAENRLQRGSAHLQARRAAETRSLSQGTAGWAKITNPQPPAGVDGEEAR